jgi:hypothetical protein
MQQMAASTDPSAPSGAARMGMDVKHVRHFHKRVREALAHNSAETPAVGCQVLGYVHGVPISVWHHVATSECVRSEKRRINHGGVSGAHKGNGAAGVSSLPPALQGLEWPWHMT